MKPQLSSPMNDLSPMYYKRIQGTTLIIEALNLSYEGLFIKNGNYLLASS